jgi:putative phosphoribosyl transferase
VIIATPVAPPTTIRRLAAVADDVISVRTPENFFAIGEWYADFSPTSDEEVRRLLRP